jgi:hypothetical protein
LWVKLQHLNGSKNAEKIKKKSLFECFDFNWFETNHLTLLNVITIQQIESDNIKQMKIKIKYSTVKLGYNKHLGAAKFVRYNREFLITGVIYVLNMDLGLKYLFVTTGGS